MSLRRFALLSAGVALAVGLVSVSSRAAEKEMLQACAIAYAKEYLPAGHPVKIVTRDATARPAEALLARHHVRVTARGSRTGTSYGSATCVIGEDGELLAMQVNAPRVRVAQAKKTQAASPRG